MVTLTTVGYGDISPSTSIGLMFAVLILIFGYVIIAVPTGIVTVESGKVSSRDLTTEVYHFCSREGYYVDAKHCKYCGNMLNPFLSILGKRVVRKFPCQFQK